MSGSGLVMSLVSPELKLLIGLFGYLHTDVTKGLNLSLGRGELNMGHAVVPF